MNVQTVVKSVQTAWAEHLKAVVRYGAVDQNLLIVLNRITAEILDDGADTLRKWVRGGHPMPFLFDEAFLRQSADTFPIDYLDMQDHHQVLWGTDPLQDIVVDHRHLRQHCEFELRSKLIHLKSEYVLNCQKPAALLQLMVHSLASTDRILTGVAHLVGEKLAGDRREAALQLAPKLDIRPEILIELYDVHDKKLRWRDMAQIRQKFEHYLTALQGITKFVDGFQPMGHR